MQSLHFSLDLAKSLVSRRCVSLAPDRGKGFGSCTVQNTQNPRNGCSFKWFERFHDSWVGLICNRISFESHSHDRILIDPTKLLRLKISILGDILGSSAESTHNFKMPSQVEFSRKYGIIEIGKVIMDHASEDVKIAWVNIEYSLHCVYVGLCSDV